MITHGGNLREAALRYARPLQDWIDLSTGINPNPYPAPVLAANAWHRLPEPDPALVEAACAYYEAPALLPVAGSQAAIQGLPRLRAPARVAVSAPSYAEHAHCWRKAGHRVQEVPFDRLADAVPESDVVVVCNPNNPTGECIAPATLLQWAAALAARGGWLVVDEAFGDTMPEQSIASHCMQPAVIVLRSVGKFFGLAGLRLGFVGAHPDTLAELAEYLGPWAVSGPAQQVAGAALRDHAWQRRTRAELAASGKRLRALLAAYDIESQGTALFQWWPHRQSQQFAQHMAQRGIWVRRFDGPARGIRLGLPADEPAWQRLGQALADLREMGALA